MADQKVREMEPVETQIVEIMPPDVENLIYVVRNKQVMVDSDLAMLYQVETGALNRAVKRNIARFPEDFRFQLTKDEYENLKCQFGTSNGSGTENGYGGRRTLPYVFTEQGISMLASVLHSEVAINVSIGIMRAFVEMRRFIANNALLFERISNVELKQLEYQKKTDEKLEQIFEYISDHEESNQKIFFDGQIYDAFSLLIELIQKAETEIVLVDGYVDVGTLNILSKKKENVAVTVYTQQRTKLSQTDVDNFNAQYPKLDVKYTRVFHDRFLIFDKTKVADISGVAVKDSLYCYGVALMCLYNRVIGEKSVLIGQHLHFLFQPLQGKLDMPLDCAACPAALFSDFFLRQVLEVIQKDFLLCLFRQFGKSRRKGTAI